MNAPETNDNNHAELMPSDALAAIERSQVDVMIATAKRYPRSIKSFMDEAQSMIALSPEIAEGCNYKLKRKNKDGGIIYIEGPSVRLLEIAASAYGNLRYGSRTLAIDEDFVTSQGMAFDLERNVASSVETKRSIKGKFGRYSQDMIMITANAAGSIARRNALNGVIPRVYIQSLSEHAKKVALGDIKTLPDRRQRAFDYFTKTLGVSVEKVLEYLEKPSVEDCNLADVSDLQDLKTALKEGMTTLEETFSPPKPSVAEKPPLESKEKPKAAATVEAPPEPPKTEPPKPKEQPAAPPTPPKPPKEAPPSAPPASIQQPAAELPPEVSTPPITPTSATSDPTTPQEALKVFLGNAGVEFAEFKDWLGNSGRYRDASTIKDWPDIPLEICKQLGGDGGKALGRCVKLFGKTQ